VYVVRPNRGLLTLDLEPAFIYAHGNGLCMGSAKDYLYEAHRFAYEWNCVCFSVDYRKAPEF